MTTPHASAADERPDLRLVVPALAAWLTAALAARAPALAVATLATAVGAGALAARRATPARRGRVAAVTLGATACALAALVAVTGRAASTRAGPLPGLASARSVVTLDVVVTADPVAVTGRVVGAQRVADSTVVRARAEVVRFGAHPARVRTPLVVFGDAPGWSGRLPGERLRVTGRLAPSTRDRGVVLDAHGPPQRLRPAPVADRVAGRLRAGLRRAAHVLPPDARGLLPGLVVGDTSGLDPRVREDFRRTGLTHLVAVSGQNVAILLTAALLLARRAGLGPRTAAGCGGVLLAFFVVLARPSPSVLRATAMGGLGLVATVTGRERGAVRLLAAAVLLLVLADPALARSVGFALSTSATAGLLVLAPPWRARLARRLPGWLADALALPLAAQAACAPVLAAAFGRLSVVAIPANVLAAPAVGPATVAGVLAAATAPLSMPLARALALVAGVPTGWLVAVAARGARVPAGLLAVPTGLAGAALTALLVAATVAALHRRTGRYVLAVAATAVALAGTLVYYVAPSWPPPGWRLVACDVGQGDALLVRTGGATVVVDTGPDPIAAERCLRDARVGRVAAVVLTHLHADHVEGLPGVLRGRRVPEVVVGPLDEPPAERDRVVAWTTAAHVPIRRAAAAERWTAGEATFEVLGPRAAFHGTASDPNNSSLVLRVTVPGLTALLTGDVEEPAQLDLLGRVPVGRADVLKVPHHGSARQTAEFLDATGARAALVSVGTGNPYGHPAASTLDALAVRGMRTYRTDRDGDVAVVGTSGRVRVVARRGSGTPPAPARVPPAALARIAWRRATEPGVWCPAGPARAPPGPSRQARPHRRPPGHDILSACPRTPPCVR